MERLAKPAEDTQIDEEQPAVCFWVSYLTKGNYFPLQSVINITLF